MDHSRSIFRKSLMLATAETQVKSDGQVAPKHADYRSIIILRRAAGMSFQNYFRVFGYRLRPKEKYSQSSD
jgi:hypothetical protein